MVWYGLAIFGFAAVMGGMVVWDVWLPNKWLIGDGAFYLNEVNSLLAHGSLRQEYLHPHSWYEVDLGWNLEVDSAFSNVALGRHGEWWPKHPYLMPIVAAPFVWAYGAVGSLICHFLCYALIAVLAFRIAARVASPAAAFAAAAALVATPWFAHCAWGFNNDVFYTVLILSAVEAALADSPRVAGLLLGVGIFAKATNVLYGPALLAVFLLRRDWRGALRFCLWASGPALLYLGLNAWMFGGPLRTGYDRVLVREAGKVTTHSVAKDFHLQNMRLGLKNILLGAEGLWPRVPLFLPALCGLPLLAARRWREALVLLWCLAVPVLFHAPYVWYRLEFNLPQIALLVTPLAALLSPLAPPAAAATPDPRPWALRLALLLAFVLVATGLGRRALERPHSWLWRHLPEATVAIGDIPCDYFNNMVERWECSHYDTDDTKLTGRLLDAPLQFAGKPHEVLLLTPYSSSKPRRLTYSNVPMTKQFLLRYGLADSTRPGSSAHIKVLANGAVLHERDVSDRTLHVERIATPQLAGQRAKLTLEVTAPNPVGVIFGVDGSPLR